MARIPTFQRHFTLLYVATSFEHTQLPKSFMFRISNNSMVFIYLRIEFRLYTDMEANSILQVIEYLNKKGYSKTEACLRLESANQDVDGKSLAPRSGDQNGAKYGRAFSESHHDPSYDQVTELFSLDATVD